MRIGVDLDDVLANCCDKFVVYYNDQYGTALDPLTINYFSRWRGETKEEWLKVVEDFYASHFFDEVKPIPGAIEALALLKKQGHFLAVITARPSSIEEKTRQWLKTHHGEIFDEIVFAGHYLGVDNISKGDLCRKLAIDVIIEDAPVHAEQCQAAGTKVLLFDQPWNQKCETSNDIIRVHNWTEIVDIIEKMNAK